MGESVEAVCQTAPQPAEQTHQPIALPLQPLYAAGVSDDPVPTALEEQNAATRAAIAERQNATYAECQRLADRALGPGYRPWMKIVLLDGDHRRTGDTTPAAVCYKVYAGDLRLSSNSVYVREMPDGGVQTASNFEPLFGELLDEKHPTKCVEVKGERVPCGRYEVAWAALERYTPRTAVELASLRASRERKAVEREELRFRAQEPLWAWVEEQRREGGEGRER